MLDTVISDVLLLLVIGSVLLLPEFLGRRQMLAKGHEKRAFVFNKFLLTLSFLLFTLAVQLLNHSVFLPFISRFYTPKYVSFGTAFAKEVYWCLYLLIVLLLAPVFEEVLFRYVFFKIYGKRNFVIGLLLNSCLFSFFHFNPAQVFVAFSLSLFLNLVYYLFDYQKFFLTVLLHMLFNLSSTLFIAKVESTIGASISLLGLGLIYPIYLLYKKRKTLT